MALDEALRGLAQRQHSLVSRAQARDVGAAPAALRRRLAGPDWEAATPRVLRLVGAPRTALQTLMVLALDGGPGTFVSHLAAAALWGLPGFPFGPLEASRQRGVSGRPPGAGYVHRPRLLPAWHCTTLAGIPVTTLPRTLFDLAAVVRPARLERAVNTVVTRSPAVLPVAPRSSRGARRARPGRHHPDAGDSRRTPARLDPAGERARGPVRADPEGRR